MRLFKALMCPSPSFLPLSIPLSLIDELALIEEEICEEKDDADCYEIAPGHRYKIVCCT